MNGVDRIAEEIVMLSAKLYPLFRRFFKDYHPDEIAILHILRASGGKLQRRELIKELNIDPRIVSRRVRNLVSQRLVNSYRNEKSARESIDKITEKGDREFEGIRNKMKSLLRQGFTFIGRAEQRALTTIVKEANAKIELIESIVKEIANSIK